MSGRTNVNAATHALSDIQVATKPPTTDVDTLRSSIPENGSTLFGYCAGLMHVGSWDVFEIAQPYRAVKASSEGARRFWTGSTGTIILAPWHATDVDEITLGRNSVDAG